MSTEDVSVAAQEQQFGAGHGESAEPMPPVSDHAQPRPAPPARPDVPPPPAFPVTARFAYALQSPGAPETADPTHQPTPAAELIGHAPRGRGRLRRLVDALVDAVARGEQREPEHAVAQLRAPPAPGWRSAVTGARGCADKTAVSALLGSVLAERRPDPVPALDAAEQTGSLA